MRWCKLELRILERNVIRKKWKEPDFKFALCYPNEYRAGISNLGMQVLYFLLNKKPNVICERFYSPTKRNFKSVSVESGRSLKEFDIIGFSLQYENDYHNVISMLKNTSIPIKSSERDERFPLIVAGGPVTTNPIPMKPFIDLFIIGDFEPIYDKFFEILVESRDKRNFLEQVTSIQGIYVPRIEQGVIKKSVQDELDQAFHPIKQIIPSIQETYDKRLAFEDAMLIEVSRGCPRNCNFCMIGCQARPFRARSLNEIKKIISQGIKINKTNKITLIGAGISDHPDLINICKFLVDEKIQFSLPSLRVDRITQELLEILKDSGTKTLTLAPEASSSRLREIIGKKIDDEQIIETVSMLRKHGILNVKFYFMIGLPTEKDEDIRCIPDFYSKINSIGYSSKNLKLSVNPFIPKPHTPFQWHEMPDNKYFASTFKFLNKSIPISQIENQEARYSFMQGCLSLGDQWFSKILELTLKEGNNLGNWRRIFKILKMPFKVPKYDLSDQLPWDFIHVDQPKENLKKKWKLVIGKY